MVTIEAAEEGGGDGGGSLEMTALMLWMCGSDFPIFLIEGYGKNGTKVEINMYSSG